MLIHAETAINGIVSLASVICHLSSVVTFAYVVYWNQDASYVSFKSQVVYLLCYLLDITVGWKFIVGSKIVAAIEFFYIITTSIIVYMILRVEPIKFTYVAILDTVPILPLAMGSFLISSILYIALYQDGFRGQYWSIVAMNLGLAANIPQIVMERYHRQQQQQQQQRPQVENSAAASTTLETVQLAIFCQGLSAVLSFIHWEISASKIPIEFRFAVLFIDIIMFLKIVTFSEFFYHCGRTLYIGRMQRSVRSDASRTGHRFDRLPLDLQLNEEENGTEITSYSPPTSSPNQNITVGTTDEQVV